jgi:hypothetical protein
MNHLNWFDNSVTESLRSGWLDRNEFAADWQSKRFKAILRVWEKVSKRFPDENPFDTMPTITFFAPFLDHAGRVMRTPPMGLVVYLSPSLEFDSQRDVDHVVAHELAHVSLGHHLLDNAQMKEHAEKHEDRPAEKAAEELAAKWGFTKRKRGKSGFVKMVEGCAIGIANEERRLPDPLVLLT